MLPKFFESLGGELAKEWVAKVFTPAFIFWFGGALAWVWRFGWSPVETLFSQTSTALPLAQLIGGLLLIAVSAIALQQIELSILRLLEGYWPSWMKPLRTRWIKRQKRQADQAESRFQQLAAKGLSCLTPEEQDEYVQLDWQLRQTPVPSDRLMPTHLGNILRAAERRSFEKYGLESIVCWPRLWLVLPDGVKTELSQARANLNMMVRIWIWSLLFLIWSIWAWWAIPVGIIGMVLAYRWMLDKAVLYGDLIEAAFDLHRMELYKFLRWPLPKTPTEEQKTGRALTDYLWRGFTEPEPTFESHEKSD